METLKFKTNVKCAGCVSTITPFLEQDQNITTWKVDLENPDRVLTVETTHSTSEIQELLKKAGYSATELASE